MEESRRGLSFACLSWGGEGPQPAATEASWLGKKKKKGQRDEGKRVGREKTEKEENGKEAGGRGEVTKATWTKQEARPSP